MICKKICTESSTYDVEEQISEVQSLLKQQCEQYPEGPAADAIQRRGSKNANRRRDPAQTMRDLITAITLCNNVTPVESINQFDEEEITYQASSPDETALVKFGHSLKM